MTEKRPSTYVDNWGELIRASRSYMGLSQKSLAKRIGIAEKSLSDIEVGRRDCPPGFLDTIEAIVDEFDHAVEELSKLVDGRDEVLEMTVSDDPAKEWERAVIGRAAVETRLILPILSSTW